ncbi:MAG: alginate export family protein [Blastocatellia bacterium]|nr:alginate export family protein [Blastocatellia bacterium]
MKCTFVRMAIGCLFWVVAFTTTLAAQQKSDYPPIKAGPVEFSGSLRLRNENWGWFEVPGRDSQQNFLGGTFRFSIKSSHLLRKNHTLDWQAELEAPFLAGLPQNALAPAPQGALGLGGTYVSASGNERAAVFLKQAFVRYVVKGEKVTSAFRVGRFEFSDGAELAAPDPTVAALKRQRIQERLIGPFGFTHVGRSFDGGQLSFSTAASNLTVFAARPTEGVFQVDGLRQVPSVSLVYGAFSHALHKEKVADKLTPRGEFRVFGLWYRDGRSILKTDNRPAPLREADRRNDIQLTTIGGHYLRAFTLGTGTADVLFWGAGQFGDWGNLSHRAGAVAVEGGYQPKLKWKPWIRGGYFRSSGDGNPTDNRHGTFFQVLPTPRIYARTPFFNLMNNEDSFASLTLRPNKKFNLRSDFHKLRLSNSRDLWYLGGGAFQKQTFGFVGRPANNQRNLGGLLDVSVDYQLNPRVTISGYYGHIFGGRLVSSIYPAGQNGHLGYVELTVRF